MAEGLREIATEMKATLADLKTQIGRDMPQIDKLTANIAALETLGEAPKAMAAAVTPEEPAAEKPAGDSSGLFGVTVPEASEPSGSVTAAKSTVKTKKK